MKTGLEGGKPLRFGNSAGRPACYGRHAADFSPVLGFLSDPGRNRHGYHTGEHDDDHQAVSCQGRLCKCAAAGGGARRVVRLLTFSVVVAVINAGSSGHIRIMDVLLPVVYNVAALGIGFLCGICFPGC